jgi:hypothetical protein
VKTEWAIRCPGFGILGCRDEKHARAMMKSTSVALGPKESREVVKRQVTEWEVV